jgi:hypothetical protein
VSLTGFVGENVFKYHVFISHTWETEPEIKDSVSELNHRLKEMGIETWFHDERISAGNISDQIAKGIEESVVFLICVTRKYADQVAQDETLLPKLELNHAWNIRKAPFILPVVLEEDMKDRSKWKGSMGFKLGDILYVPLTNCTNDDFDKSIMKIADEINKKLKKFLPNEQQVISDLMCPRDYSPTSSDQSGMRTASQSPLPPSQEVIVIHVKRPVSQFRDDMSEFRENMRKFIKDFLDKPSDQPALRK